MILSAGRVARAHAAASGIRLTAASLDGIFTLPADF
jgi:hypothetical protein